MLLTLKPPIQNGIKGPHEYSVVRQSIPALRSSSTSFSADCPSTTASAKPSPERATDNARRGHPRPPSMTLTPESSVPAVTPMNQLPPPPPQWPAWEESMRHWLQTKAEEDRRRQEEERTRQECLRLEQRKIEQSMLRDSFQAGVPPHMVPLIFVGMAGGNLPRATLDIIHQLIDQTGSQNPPLHQGPPPSSTQFVAPPPPPPSQPPPPLPFPSRALQPEVRRDSRTIPPNPYGAQAGPSLPPPPPPPQAMPPSPAQQPYGQPPLFHPPPDPRAAPPPPPPPSTLSRINTTEMHIHHPPANVGPVQYQPGPAPPVKSETQSQSSPSLYFHHWVPPGQSQPNTPSGRTPQDSSPSSHSHLRSEFQSSPGRKRKAQGPHQPAPPPSTQPTESSPAMSHSPRHATPGRRGPGPGHFRQQSDASYESRYPEHQEFDPEGAPRQTPASSERDPIRTASSGAGSES
jgi:hypothetical protein